MNREEKSISLVKILANTRKYIDLCRILWYTIYILYFGKRCNVAISYKKLILWIGSIGTIFGTIFGTICGTIFGTIPTTFFGIVPIENQWSILTHWFWGGSLRPSPLHLTDQVRKMSTWKANIQWMERIFSEFWLFFEVGSWNKRLKQSEYSLSEQCRKVSE